MQPTLQRTALSLLVAIAVGAAIAIPSEHAEAQPAGSGSVYIINLKASNGQFVVAEYGGGREVKADRNVAADWERIVVVDMNGGNLASGDTVRLRAQNGQFFVAENGLVKANRNVASTWETFRIVKVGGTGVINSNDKVNLQAYDSRWVCAERGGGHEVKADRTAAGPWETFTLTFRSRLRADPSPLGTTWSPSVPPPPPPPPPQVPAGFRWVGDPECNPQAHLTAYLGRDVSTGNYYCCELTANQNANTAHCGSGHIEFPPDCMNYAPRGQLMQPFGCVERDP